MTLAANSNSLSFSQVNTELNVVSNSLGSLDQSSVRVLFNKLTGIISFYDGYGKTNYPILNTPTTSISRLNGLVSMVVNNSNLVDVVLIYSFDNWVTTQTTSVNASSSVTVQVSMIDNMSITGYARFIAASYRTSLDSTPVTAIPKLLIPSVVSSSGTASVNFTINNPNNISGITAHYSFDGTNWATVGVGASFNVTVTKTGLSTNASASCVAYLSLSGYVDSPTTQSVTGVSFPPLPSVPSVPTATGVSQTEILVEWTSVAGVTYEIQRDTSPLSGEKANTGWKDVVGVGTSHVYSVRAKNIAGYSAYSVNSTAASSYPQEITTKPWITNLAQTSLTLNFDTIAGVSGYLIYMNGAYYGSASGSGISIAVAKNTSYTFEVAVFNGGNSTHLSPKSPPSDTVTSLKDKPLAPSISSSSITANAFRIMWSAVAGDTYSIYLSGNNTYLPNPGDVTFSVSPATTYTVKVTARNSGGSTDSNLLSVTTKPEQIAIGIGVVTSTSADITWSASGTTTARVFVGGSDKGVQTSPYSVTGLTANTTTSAVVRIFNSLGEYVDSSSRDIVTLQAVPANPTLSLDTRYVNHISVTASNPYTVSTGLITFKFYLDYNLYLTTLSNTCDYTGLAESSNHTLYVVASSATGGDSQTSNHISATTLLTATNLRVISSQLHTIWFMWDCAYSSAHFRVYFDGSQVVADSANNFWTPTLNLNPGTVHNIAVTCTDTINGFDTTRMVSLTQAYTDPAAPTLIGNDTVTTYVTLGWGNMGEVDYYSIYVDGSVVATTTNLSYIYNTFKSTHEYYVVARGKSGNDSDNSNKLTINNTPLPGGVSSAYYQAASNWGSYCMWTDNPEATSYECVCTNTGNGTVQKATSYGSSAFFLTTGGMYHRFDVYSINSKGKNPTPTTVYFTTQLGI